jgi:hypothetical protein
MPTASDATPRPVASTLATAWERLALAAIVAIGIGVRLYFLGEPMRADEAFTYNEYATRSTYDAVSLYTFPNNHLFHTLLVHLSVMAFGGALWAVRLPALLAGIGMVPAAHVLARKFATPSAGLIAAALVAASDPLVSYSVNARGYTLLALFTLLLAAAAHGVASRGLASDWLAFTIIPPLGFFTVPIMLYPFGGVVAWLLLRKLMGRAKGVRLDRSLVSGLAAGALTALFYSPTIFRMGVRAVTSNQFVKPRLFAEVVRDLPPSLLEVWAQWNLDIPGPVTAALLAAWLAGLIVPSPLRAGARSMTGLLLTIAAFSLAVVLYQSVVPFDRVWLFLLPVYQVAVACGLAALATRPARGRAVVPVFAVGLAAALSWLVARSPEIPKDSARLTINAGPEIVERLRDRLGPGVAVVAELPCEAPLKYYFLVNGLPVEPLYDYRIAAARRIYVAVNKPNGQTPESVLRFNKVALRGGEGPQLVEDFGKSALYVVDRP